MSPIEEAVRLIEASGRIVMATNVSPDSDAVGSLLGLGLALRSKGKQVALLCDDPAPSRLRFLPSSGEIASSTDLQADLFIGVDASDLERLGKSAAAWLASGVPILNIDHHITNVNYGSVNLVDPQAGATAEALLPLLDALGVSISVEIGNCLAVGLVGDTRSFSTSSVTSNTLLAAARLVEAGVDLAMITEQVLHRRSFSMLRLWGLGLGNLSLDESVIWTVIPLAARLEIGLREVGDTGMSNLLISVEQAKLAAVFTEQEDGKVDISFRARPGYDVAALALSLGGGGHTLAAGCMLKGTLDEVVGRVVPLLKAQVVSSQKKD
jgi:phosphoesterase RecJ-like protein